MVVGPNSALVIDEFLFRANAAENRLAVRVLGGAFRFISGEIGDRGYLIRTPSGTIGVRGTAFDFVVTPSGGTKLVLLAGEVTLCGKGGDCTTVTTACELLQTNTGQDVKQIKVGKQWLQETRSDFPYLTSQSTLLEAFRIEGPGCLLRRPVGTILGALTEPPAGPGDQPGPGDPGRVGTTSDDDDDGDDDGDDEEGQDE
jgi:hypothetical protein